MFSKIKNYFLQKYLTENKKVRQRQILSLQQARTIGILCEITDENSYKDIFRVFSMLQATGQNVKLIGYINEKEVPFFCLQQLSADYFSNKHLNWYGNPTMVQVQDFIQKDFDVLIDFNYRYNPPVRAILSLSNAKFIIGREPENSTLYDLFMDKSLKDNQSYLKEIYTYTKMLTGYDK
jgi:hypothetical protein